MSDVVMRAQSVSKVYGGTHALRGVDFEVRAGRVIALLGENGAGKSTLMKILAGVEQPTTGRLELDGQPVRFESPSDAVGQGVAIIHQELNLCPNLSVADNIFMGRERGRAGFVDYAGQRELARALFERLEEPIDPRRPVGELRLGQQQLVEIARALSEDARVLVMDEPTSALSAAEAQVLFRVIRDLTAHGVAIVYISHHLDECLEIADDAVVLRDGAVVASAPMHDVDLSWIVENMVGRDQDDLYAPMAFAPGDPLLELRDVVVADPENAGRLAVRGVSLTVHEGEVVGLYGLMGAGRTELLEAVAGRNDVVSGDIRLAGTSVTGLSIAERIRRGLALVPEDRQRDGLVQALSVGRNLSLAALGGFLRGLVLNKQSESAAVRQMMSAVRVKAAGPDAEIGSLSGGNQQKVVVGKVLMTTPRVIVLDEPTRGIDVGAKADIFALMAQQAKEGRGVLFATSEVEEVLHSADRIVVLSRGRVAAELDPRTTTREDVMAASGESLDGSSTNGGEPREARAAPTATRGRRSRRVVGRDRLPNRAKEASPHEPTD